MPSEKQNSFEPVFIIGAVIFGIQVLWFVMTRLSTEWYKSGMITIVSLATSLAVPVLCIYFVKDQKQRSILIVLVFLSVALRMSEQWFLRS
jgi:hypothetical protein